MALSCLPVSFKLVPVMFPADKNCACFKLICISLLSFQGLAKGEVPVGAVLVLGDDMVCSAHNQVEHLCDPTAHAEMLCIREGAKRLGMR